MSTQIPQDSSQAARLHYGDGEFAVLSAGAFVRCAVTGAAIPLTAVRYWSVERQEAYAGPREYLTAASTS
ncbi:DUF2093 domain-containing protein [Brevundimonas guildfordensis]|jgi:hypothetical protein|uniref:DUF2093 domain-containing protein n=1 Tax=Brevundimonas guildfordensis TaxID=2762241 RepID=A0ABR8QZT3_9CAUL|nr:DUF2093 domain-containing protein [Brevundimonas guildfordensis]MBD7941045.1 DUF2093 domain-containing protein [Brevundimonas guildfordensis]